MKKALATLAATAALISLNACASTTDTGTAPAGTSSSATPTSTAASPSTSPSTDAPTPPSADGTPITITAGDQTFNATINDSQVSQDFLATLPATLTWNRNAGIEYITELDEPMTETGPFYTDFEAGDIVYYNPMDSITIIYAPPPRCPPSPRWARSPPTSPPSRTCPTPSKCRSPGSSTRSAPLTSTSTTERIQHRLEEAPFYTDNPPLPPPACRTESDRRGRRSAPQPCIVNAVIGRRATSGDVRPRGTEAHQLPDNSCADPHIKGSA